MSLPSQLTRALQAFQAGEPRLRLWADYPQLTQEEHTLTDGWACREVSLQLVNFLRARELSALLVHAQEAEHPWHYEHYWARVGEWEIDYTARQFHNLEHPPTHAHQNLPCPLIWRAENGHPVSGSYRLLSTG